MADILFKLDVDTSNLDASVDKSLKEIRSMGKAVGASVGDINKAFTKLGKELVKNVGADKALTTLNKKMKDQADKVADLRKEYDALDEKMTEFSKNGGKAKDWADIKQFEKVSAELKKAQSEYDQLSAAMAGAEQQAAMFTKTVNGITYEGSSARGVLMQMQAALDKMGEEGKSATAEYENLRAAIANLKDATSDAKQAVSGLASDTAKLDAIMGGLNVAAGGFSAVVGSMEMFGAESEDVAEAQKKLQAAIAITTGFTALQNNLQKQSNLMLGIHNIQTAIAEKGEKMLAAAKNKGTAATIAATVAQKAFNVVAKANPYLLLFLALMTVVGGILAFSQGIKRAEKDQQKAAESAQRWAQRTKEIYEIEKRLVKVRQDAAKQAVDLASAEGKSAREVLALKEQQLKVDQEINTKAKKNHSVEIKNLDNNRKALERYERELETAKASKGSKYEFIDENGKKQKGKIDDTYIETIQARVDAYRAYVEIAEEVIATEQDLKVSAAQLAEEKRQLAIEEANANTQARRTTEDMRAELMTDEKAKQRKQTAATYDRQIEDLKTRLANEKNLTVEQREEMNKQIILLDQQKKKALEDLRRQDLNDQYNAQKEVQAKMRDLTVERMEQETNDTLKALQEKAQVEKQARLDELEEQKQAWIKAQGGLMDSEGKYSDESKLTKEQKDYLQSAAKNINDIFGDGTKVLGSMIEKEIYDKYSSAFQRAVKDNKRFEDDIALMAGAGKDTSEVERQRNEQALAYMQDVEGGLTPEFKMWIDSLGDYTTKTLESMLASAEEQLWVLKAMGAPQEWIIEAEARIAALNNEVKQAQTDIQRGPKLTAYKNLNKVLGDAASGFEALGQTGNEAFDSLMKNVADITNTVQSVIANIQTLVQSATKGMEKGAEKGAEAVKTVEKASVILAIIGAALALAMKIKSMFADDGSRTEEVTKQVDALRNALRDLKREMALDVSQNDTIFGDNAYKNLMQYTQATKDYAKEYEKSVNEMALAGLEAQRRGMKGQVETGWFGMQGKKEKADIDRMFDDIESQYKDRTLSLNESVELLMNNTLIQTQKRGWLGLRKEKYKALSEIAKDNGLSIIGGDDAETIQNLKALKESVSDLDDETKTAIDNMIADWETYNQALEGVKSTYTSWFGDMASTFADSIKLGFTDGAKAGRDNFKEQVNGMLSDMFLQLTIGKNMESIMGKYTDEIAKLQMQGASPTEIANTAAKAADEFLNNYDTSLKAYEDFQNQLEQRGFGIKDSIDGTLSGAIKGASQESIDLLSGYCNAVRIQQVDGINIMREQLISLSGIERNTLNTNTILGSFKSSVENLLTADSVRASGAVLN